MGKKTIRMCKWNRKKLKKDMPAFAESIKNPNFVCTKCVRAANQKKHLCKPVPLDDKKKEA